MIVSFLLGLVAGWGAGFAEDQTRGLFAKAFAVQPSSFQPVELRAMTLILCLLLAAILAWIISSPSAVALMVGAAVGVALPRLQERLKAARTPDYDS